MTNLKCTQDNLTLQLAVPSDESESIAHRKSQSSHTVAKHLKIFAALARSADRVSCGDRIEGLLAFDSRRHLPQRGRHHRLVGALLLEQNDEWAVQRSRYMTLETIAQTGDDAAVSSADMTG